MILMPEGVAVSENQSPFDLPPSSEFEKTAVFSPADSAAQLVSVLDQYLADLQAGHSPDRAQLLIDHQELAHELADCLAGIEFVHQAAKPVTGIPTQLGDFRIVREVGRGGMGVVYEAEQLSLKRRVALKVLRFGVTADAELMQRFQREAETVAHLHHTNIVPIHAVGCEQGVHYYAMQFIEGESLAAVLVQLGHDRSAGQAVDFRQVAGWMLQAAEALAHAHQRGVIHRDIKPSNLILDPEGTVWLTDFGLAKRADEVTMTAAGILMGTPRYMSPEQAAAARQPIDHRTDIYSLGATLYELATGKPVFDGTTPQGVITQILNTEPVAPRVLQGMLPRDLETIILKSLAKNPVGRYQHARDLADDLRAYLDNRPIRARRATLRERAVRWARKHQRSTLVSAVTAAASLLLILGSWVGWQAYHESLQGRLLFTTDGPTLVAEVLNQAGEPVMPGFPVPNPQPVTLPAGPYQVRFSGPGMLSETWQFDVARGGPQTFPVKMLDRQLGPALNVAGTEPPLVIELDGQTQIVHRTEQGWRLVKGDTLKPVWPADLIKILSPAERELYPRSYVSDGDIDLLQVSNPWSATGTAPGLADPAVDVNGDGRQDLIFASRVSPSLLGVSGSTGQVLWWYRAAPPLPPDYDAVQDPLDPKSSAENAGVIGKPVLVDMNGEPVVIACFVSMQSHLRTTSGKAYSPGQKFFMEAVAARTGTRIWRSVFDLPELAQKSSQEVIRLFPPSPVIKTLSGRETILLHVGTRIFAWDLETGKERWQPYEMGATPVQLAQYSDLDGDGESEALLVFLKEASYGSLTLKAVSLKTRELLWEQTCRTPLSLNQLEWFTAGNELVWIVDLNGDGRGEVLVPVRDDWGKWGRHWYGLELLEGATGTRRWTQRLRLLGQFSGSGLSVPVRVLVGPDLDGDAHADLFAVSTGSEVRSIYDTPSAAQIDAVSGQDGRHFWRQRQKIAENMTSAQPGTTTPHWWQSGDEGWPQLIVPVGQGVGGQPISYVYAANTGRLIQTLPEVADPQIADINSDGIPDIWYLSKSPSVQRMTVLKGMPPVHWRRPGTWRLAADFDADGTVDFLEFRSKHLAGRCGRDGHILWETRLVRTGPPYTLVDLNQDGVDDIVVFENDSRRNRTLKFVRYESHTVLAGFSGKTGQRIWTSPDCGLRDSGSSMTGGYDDEQYSIPMLGSRDLDGDGRPEILVAAYFDDASAITLAAFSGQEQSLLWKVPVDENCLHGRAAFDRIFHDLNGDGVLDVVLSAPKMRDEFFGNLTIAGLRAYSGRDGQPLWKDRLADQFPIDSIMRLTHPLLGDLDGDGVAEVIVAARETKGFDPAASRCRCELIVLDGRSGERRWSWPWMTDGSFQLWRPILVNLDGDRTRCVCLGINEVPQYAPQIIILESTGVVRRRMPVSWVDFWSSLWGRDLDGDGREELIFRSKDELQAYREMDQSILWKQSGVANWFRLVQPRVGAAAPADILTFQYGEGAALGLDAASGAVRWRVEPPQQSNQAMRAELMVPTDPTEHKASISVDALGESTLEQTIWQTESNARFRAPPAQPMTYAAFEDPDKYRPLPWVPNHQRPWTSPGAPRKPVGSDDWISLLLVIVVIARCLFWIRQNRWRWALTYLAIAPLISLVAAVIMLSVNSGQLDVDEHYLWSGWAWILLHGTIILGSLTVAVTVLVWLAHRLRTWLRRRKS